MEKIKSLDELNKKGLYIIEDDNVVVENNIEKICKERGLLISDLARITGISRQNINAVTKNKMKPGIDFALKCSYVLGLPVEEIFSLSESAWIKPYKQERDSTLYINMVTLEIIDNTIKKEEVKKGYEYYNKSNSSYISKIQRDKMSKEYVDSNIDNKVEELRNSNKKNYSLQKINSLAIEMLKDEFNQEVIKVHQKLGEKIKPYVVEKR